MTTLIPKQPFFLALAIAISIIALPCCAASTGIVSHDGYGGRNMIVYVPSRLPAPGKRGLVVVLHGGLGSAQRIQSGQSENDLNIDAVAEQDGFIVAYLNGTPVARFWGADRLGWNAGGGCCGQPAANKVDDVGYIAGAVGYLSAKFGVERNRIYGIGHSNGAMMIQRLLCETNIFAAAVPISGPLNLEAENCPAARGKRILAIHGEDDENVPVLGGRGAKGISRVAFESEAHSRRVFLSSGAFYQLQLVKGADHSLGNIDKAIQKTEGQTIAEKAAAFFGLARETH